MPHIPHMPLNIKAVITLCIRWRCSPLWVVSSTLLRVLRIYNLQLVSASTVDVAVIKLLTSGINILVQVNIWNVSGIDRGTRVVLAR